MPSAFEYDRAYVLGNRSLWSHDVSRFRIGLCVSILACYSMLLAGCSRITPTSVVPPKAASAVPAEPVTAALAPVELATDQPEPTSSPTVTASPIPTSTPIPSTATPSPTALQIIETPPATPVATDPLDTGVYAVIVKNPVNLRGGPDTGYDIVGEVISGQRYPVLARSENSDWWQIDANGTSGWVSASLVSIEGNGESLPIVAEEAQGAAESGVQAYETTLSIPTYPYAAFTEEVISTENRWTYRRFNQAAYEASNPQPLPWSYTAVVLENELLRITMLPDLGGRVYQVIFKPTGNNEMYENPVIKPSPWGPPEQGGWLAAGGIEWGLPVEEHGYVWGDPWGHITVPYDETRTGVTLFMPNQEDHLRAEVDVILRAGEAAFTLQPRISNPTGQAVDYQFWLDALLAPGPANRPGPNLRFILPTEQVTVHSRGDASLPEAQAAMAWPLYAGRDNSRLGNWTQFLGFFERPAAHGPFAAVYDEDADEGIVRVFPPAATRGSKFFALGWDNPTNPIAYTDDGSAYVELHGGVTPTFWDRATLAAGDTTSWQETWFPVAGIGGVSYADGNGAVHLRNGADGLEVGVFPIRSVAGRLLVAVDGQLILEEDVTVGPAQPFHRVLPVSDLPATGTVSVTLVDADSKPVLDYAQSLTQ